MSDLGSSPTKEGSPEPGSFGAKPPLVAVQLHPDMIRRKEERLEKQRVSLREVLMSDYLEIYKDQDDVVELAEELADEKLDYFMNKKEGHIEVMRRFSVKAKEARGRLGEAEDFAKEFDPLLVSVRGKPTPEGQHQIRGLAEQIRSILISLAGLESDLCDLEREAQKAFYRPNLEKDPAAEAMKGIRSKHHKAWAALNHADYVLEELATPSAPAPAAEDKRPFARDFPVSNYVTNVFTGDETTALSDYHVWKGQWKHVTTLILETCKEADAEAFLHLLCGVLGGTAKKITAAALSVEAVLEALKEKYDDVVALVESYLTTIQDNADKSIEEKVSGALAFANRWGSIRAQLAEQKVDMDTFCGRN